MSPAGPDRRAQIAELIDRHYGALGGGLRKDCDCHWSISERYCYGRLAGWVVEHDGYSYNVHQEGEDGPFATREEAEAALIDHLLAAIARIEARER